MAVSNLTFPLQVEVSATGYHTVRTYKDNYHDVAEVKLEPLASDSDRAERTVTVKELSRDAQVSAQRLQREAVNALAKGDNSRAQELLSKALQLSPSSSSAYNNLGVALLRQRNPGKAMTCFEKAVNLAPYDASPSGNLGLLRWLQGRYDESYVLLDRAVTLGFSSTVARSRLAILALQRERFEQALQLLSNLKPEECARRDLLLFLCLQGLGSEQEASKAFQRYLSQNPVKLMSHDLGLKGVSTLP
jgi:Flp pilus assembly protein TadD